LIDKDGFALVLAVVAERSSYRLAAYGTASAISNGKRIGSSSFSQ
jgi:hypothetical protein